METASRTGLANDVLQTYLALGDALRLAALPDWFAADLSLSQLKAIFLLEQHGVLTGSELARLLGTGNSAASILVQQMVEGGLVERSQDALDRRRTLVRPPRNTRLIAGRRESIQSHLLCWLSQMSEEDLASLQRGLRALISPTAKAFAPNRGSCSNRGSLPPRRS